MKKQFIDIVLEYNYCPVHGILAPSEISVGGSVGGIPICCKDDGNCQQILERPPQEEDNE